MPSVWHANDHLPGEKRVRCCKVSDGHEKQQLEDEEGGLKGGWDHHYWSCEQSKWKKSMTLLPFLYLSFTYKLDLEVNNSLKGSITLHKAPRWKENYPKPCSLSLRHLQLLSQSLAPALSLDDEQKRGREMGQDCERWGSWTFSWVKCVWAIATPIIRGGAISNSQAILSKNCGKAGAGPRQRIEHSALSERVKGKLEIHNSVPGKSTCKNSFRRTSGLVCRLRSRQLLLLKNHFVPS